MSGRRFTPAGGQRVATGKNGASHTAVTGNDFGEARARQTYREVMLPVEKPKRQAKPIDPEWGLGNLVAATAVEAAGILARAWPDAPYPVLRSVTIHALYLEFAKAAGMRVPETELVLAPRTGAGLVAFLDVLRGLPFADLTSAHFGAAHETLTGHGLVDGRIEANDGRRGPGVHFTPRSLTGPIVAKTLEPILPLVPPERTLDLRVADPAVGAGAFLLELVRQLGARVLGAGLAADLHEAMRLVAIHCAYGVDTCRFAVASAKLALTLECRADRMPHDWLDDNIKRGDTLVGLATVDMVARFHWSPDGKDTKGLALPEYPELRAVVDRAMADGVGMRKARIASLSQFAKGAA